MYFGPVIERCIPLAAALRRQVHHIPNRIQLINAALFDILGQPRMATVKMAQRAITVAWLKLSSPDVLGIFAAEIVLGAIAGTQQT